eukprot:gnl/Dysnectes_brevis/6370_a9832_188.p2 GENE.gnl/Dysnectes_brevis/6370_a9832_188~~gnl/Dysnectes_brevis/6370_a9832_188.p2  ORF type:complete len:396 (-),score=145.05 gnl/Dysnectes_brevis/6370_a9832_188:116-1303(-)
MGLRMSLKQLMLLGTIPKVHWHDSKMDQPMVPVNPLCPRALTQLCCLLMSGHAQTGVTVTLDLGLDLPTQVVTSQQLIRYLIHNLLTNALQATRKGEVSLRLRHGEAKPWFMRCYFIKKPFSQLTPTSAVYIQPLTRPPPLWLHYSVEDTGPGMRRVNASSICQPTRARSLLHHMDIPHQLVMAGKQQQTQWSRRKRKPKFRRRSSVLPITTHRRPLGDMGLAICRQAIAILRGAVRVTTTTEGSRVDFSIPVSTCEEEEVPCEHCILTHTMVERLRAQKPPNALCVLLTTAPREQAMLSGMLTWMGLICRQETNPNTLQEVIEELDPWCVIVDINTLPVSPVTGRCPQPFLRRRGTVVLAGRDAQRSILPPECAMLFRPCVAEDLIHSILHNIQ